MSEMSNPQPQMIDGVLVVSRFFAVPREVVWRAWTEANQFQRWFMPRGFSMPHCTLNARVGGSLHFLHRNSYGEETWVNGVFRELVPPERFEWELFFSDEEGHLVERLGFPRQSRVTVTLEERAGGTEITVRHAGLLRDQGEGQGWTESLDRLAELLAGSNRLKQETTMDAEQTKVERKHLE